MNSERKAEFIQGEFLDNQDLEKLNRYLAAHNQNFRFSLVENPVFKIDTQTIGIILAGTGSISGDADFEFEKNDILLLSPGEYGLSTANFQILLISGQNLFENPGIVKQTDFPILLSTLGGTRKLLKADEGKFNIDVHLIWVDEKNLKIPHYHQKLFELYLIEAGSGKILLKKPESEKWQDKLELRLGRFVLVSPLTVHCAQGEELVIQVVGIPAFYENDSVVVE